MIGSNKLMVTIHGISSESDRLTNFAQLCQTMVPGLGLETIFWENVPASLLFHPSIRELISDTVYYHLKDIANRYQRADITVIAHSYGTIAFVEALQKQIVGFRARTVIFLGSVVRRNFKWSGWLESGVIGQVLNVVRPFDWVVSRSNLIGGGYSGTRGFILNAHNHFKNGGHSDYYPGDVSEVSSLITGNDVEYVSFETWFRRLSLTRRLQYRVLSALRILR